MKRILKGFYLALALACLGAVGAMAQVQVGATSYTTLKAAFDAINAGTHTGAITIQITGNVTEAAGANPVLQASGFGSASYTSVTIYPTVEATITCPSGQTGTAALPIVLAELRGADNVSIDGRINQTGSTNSLTFYNPNTTYAACVWMDSVATGTSAIPKGASNNTFKYCNFIGSGTGNTYVYGIVSSVSTSITTGGVGMNNITIQNNNFAALYYGIRLYGISTAANYLISPNIQYNTFGANGAAGGGLVYCVYTYYTTGLQAKYNSVRVNTTSTCYGIYSQYGIAGADLSYNNISNNISSGLYGVYNAYSPNSIVTNNTVNNNTTTSALYGIYNYYGTSPYSNYTLTQYNEVKNNTSTGGTVYGIAYYYSGYGTCKDNVVENLTGYYNTYGIYLYNAPNSTVMRNTIKNVTRTYASASYGTVGIDINSSSNNCVIVNNVISGIYGGYNNTSAAYLPSGIRVYAGTGHNIQFNSVNLYGTNYATDANAGYSAALNFYSASNTGCTVKNNSFCNTMTGSGTFTSFAVYSAGTGMLTGATFNNNNYYVGGTQGVLAYMGANITTIADWRTATSQEAASISANPMYNDNMDLRPLGVSPLLGAGAPDATHTTDMLNVVRSATAPTIGAYEVGGEFAPPSVTFTALEKTILFTNRTLNATITDYSGVNTTAGLAPRIYYRKSTNTNAYNDNTSATDGWKYTEASAAGNIFTFTIDYSKLNGGAPAVGTVIEYFVVAQDLAPVPNFIVKGATLANSPATVVLTSASFPATAQNNYKIVGAISGTFTVGTSGNFADFSSPTGFFNYINENVVVGNITANVISDITEPGGVALNQPAEDGVGNYTITIQPASATNYTISANIQQAVLRFIGTDRVTIDGRYNGEGKYLTIKNDFAGTSLGVSFTSLGTGAGATNNTIRNCKFFGSSTALSTWGISFNGSPTSVNAAGYDNDNNSVINNEFTKLYYGVGGYGNAGSMDNFVVTGNTFGSPIDTMSIGNKAIIVSDCNNTLISGNKITNVVWHPDGSATNLAAIELSSGTMTNTTVSNNVINGVHQPDDGGWGAYGINVASSSTTNTNIYNNVITDITTRNYSSGTTYNAFGIRITGGSVYNIMHNTVNMSAATPAQGTTAPISAAVCFTSSSITGLTLQNNILINQTTFSLAGGKSYALYMASGTTVSSSNNLFYVGGANGVMGYNGSDITTIDALKTALTDVTSISKLPVFTNTNDNNIQYPSTNDADLLAPVLAAVTTDIHGETRTAVNNLKGVDVVVFNAIGLSKDLATSDDECGLVAYSMDVVPYVSGFADGIARSFPAGDADGYVYTWYHNGVELSEEDTEYTINRNVLTINSLQEQNVGTYNCNVTLADKSVNSNTLTLGTIVPLEVLNKTNEYLGCMNMTDFTLTANATGTITGYQWFKYSASGEGEGSEGGAWVAIPDATTNIIVVPVTTYENTVGQYKCEVHAPVSVCGDAMQAAFFNVNMDLNLTGVEFSATDEEGAPLDNMNLCEDAYLKFTATPTGYAVGYKWQVNRNNVWVDLPLVEYPTANTNTLIIEKSRAEHTGKYRVIVYGSPVCNQNFTAEYEIQVFELFSFKSAPQSATLCEGGSINMGVVGNGEIVSYQWTFDGEPIDIVSNPTAATPFLEIPNATYLMSGAYACNLQVRDCRGVTSTVSPAGYAYVMRATEITSEPVSTYAKLGDKAVYTVGAHHRGKVPPSYKDKFQWFRYSLHNNTVTMLTDNGRYNGTNSSVMSISGVTGEDYTTNGDYFFVVVEGICGNDTSKAVTLDLPPVVTIDITAQPASLAVCQDGSAEFDVVAETASGNTLTYQWYFNGGMLNDGVNITGAKTSKLQLANLTSNDAGIYTVTVDIVGGGSAINSQAADLAIKTKPTIITDLADMTVLTGRELKLTVTAEGTDPLTYTWTKDGVAINTTATNEYVVATAADTDAGTYQVTITNDCGEVKSTAAVVAVTKKVVVGVEESSITSASIAPNPAQDNAVITFNSNATGMATIVIMDVLGNEVAKVYEGTIGAGMNRATLSIAQSNLVSGTYYAVISTANGKQAVQFVVVR